MKLEYVSKSQEYGTDGKPSMTKVILGNSDGAVYPVRLLADKISLSNSQLFEEALEKIYEENFPKRAETEKFNAIDKKVESKTEENKQEILRTQKFLDLIADILATTIPDLFTHQYKAMMTFITPGVKGTTYGSDTYITVPHDDKYEDSGAGNLVLVQIMTDSFKYEGETYEELLANPKYNRGGINLMPYSPKK